MIRWLASLAALALVTLGFAAPAEAQTAGFPLVVSVCGTIPSGNYRAGSYAPFTIDVTGHWCTSGGGGGGVSSITTGACLTGGGTGAVTIGATFTPNTNPTLTGGIYTVLASDACKHITFTSGTPSIQLSAQGTYGSISFWVDNYTNSSIPISTTSPDVFLLSSFGNVAAGSSCLISTDSVSGWWTSAGCGLLPSIANNRIESNISGSTASPVGNTTTAVLDATIGSTIGSVLVRGSSTWGVVTPVALGDVLTDQGVGNPPIMAPSAATGPAKISTTTGVSGASSITWTGLTTTYNNYILYCTGLTFSGSPTVEMQFGEGGTPTWETSGYQFYLTGRSATGAVSSSNATPGYMAVNANPMLTAAGITGTISSGTYTTGTGAVVLTMSSSPGLVVGAAITLSSLTGTGSVSSLNGTWVTTAGTSGTTIDFTGTTGLGTVTITGGTLTTAAGGTLQFTGTFDLTPGAINHGWNFTSRYIDNTGLAQGVQGAGHYFADQNNITGIRLLPSAGTVSMTTNGACILQGVTQ